MQNSSTIDLHNIQDDIFLGFLISEPFKPTPDTIDATFFGGNPVWLEKPDQSLLSCKNCRINLTFLGQLYCSFEADHTYHRILYFLFCDQCLRQFKCLRQQASKDWKPAKETIETNLKKCCEESFEIDSQAYSKKQFMKNMNKARQELEEQKAIEEAPSDEEDDEVVKVPKMKEESDVSEDGMDELVPEKEIEQKFDIVFEQYKKVISKLEGPCLLYTDIPLPYNSQPINNKHFCKACGSKLILEAQITEKILILDEKNPNSKLFLMDWGSIFIFTCSSSCKESKEEDVVVQCEEESIKEEEIKKLKKRKRNKKKSEKKSLSKGKKKMGEEEGPKQTEMEEEGEGDWD